MLLSDADWQGFFTSFKQSAFRLETRSIYTVPDEQANFRRFLSGERPPKDRHYPWLDLVRGARDTGRTMRRVHVVTRPLSDYLRFEFQWGYVYSVKAGEEIRILDLTDQPNPGLPEEDFWMFDERQIIRMLYRTDGTHLGRDKLVNPDLGRYLRYRDLAWENSIPFEDYRDLTGSPSRWGRA
jgi:hypothetical protein